MSTVTEIPSANEMLENIISMAANGAGTAEPDVAMSVCQDIIDECVRYQQIYADLDDVIRADAKARVAADIPTDRVEALLAIVADTHTKTGAVLAVLEKAGLLDDVARGLTAAPKAIVRGVKAIKAARKKGSVKAQRVMSKGARKGSKAR